MYQGINNSLMDLMVDMVDDHLTNPNTELTQSMVVAFANSTLCLNCDDFDDVISHVHAFRGETLFVQCAALH